MVPILLNGDSANRPSNIPNGDAVVVITFLDQLNWDKLARP
jgi:hypothetical protein